MVESAKVGQPGRGERAISDGCAVDAESEERTGIING